MLFILNGILYDNLNGFMNAILYGILNDNLYGFMNGIMIGSLNRFLNVILSAANKRLNFWEIVKALAPYTTHTNLAEHFH
jgi:hypothetical protein